jgi:hypothetical protein
VAATPQDIGNTATQNALAEFAGDDMVLQPGGRCSPLPSPAYEAQTHMWTAPSSQGVRQRFDQIACVHMSGLSMRSHMNAGQDGFRDTGSKQQGDL